MLRGMLGAGLLPLVLAGAAAAGPPAAAAGQPVRPTTKDLAEALRSCLLHYLPETLYEARPGWGQTAKVPTGLKWTDKGVHPKVQVTEGQRNTGLWREVHVTAPNLASTLLLAIRNVRSLADGRTAFDVWITFEARIEYRQQKWRAGVKVFGGRARARLQVQVALACELSTQLDWNGTLLPEAVVRLRVTRAHVGYDHLVVEHIAGVGGDAARILGKAIEEGIHQWHPAIEQKLLARANAALEKAAETREIRLGLGSLLRNK